MFTRKEMKQKARQSLRKHYLIFVIVCAVAAMLGSEFSGSLNGIRIESREKQTHNTTVNGIVGGQPNLSDVVLEALQGNEKGRIQKKGKAMQSWAGAGECWRDL